MGDIVTEDYKCPVCLEIPETEIYQCKLGHIVCSSCSENLFACPQCRTPYGIQKIRNCALEGMLNKKMFNCIYHVKGCTVQVRRSEITRHAEICSFGEYVLNFCELLGYSCDFQVSIKRTPEMLNHFLECHHLAICHDTDIYIRMEGISDFKQNRKSMWYPVVMDLERQLDAKLLLLSLYYEKDQTISFICLNLSDTGNEILSSNDFRVEFTIQATKIEEASDLIWTVMPISIKFATQAIKNKLYQFPVNLLRNFYLKDGTLLLSCSVSKDMDDISSLQKNPATLCTFNVPMTRKIQKETLSPSEPDGRKISAQESKNLKFGCDNCENAVSSLPYRCLQCVKFHICETCMEDGAHGQHIFAKFYNFRHEYEIGKMLNWKWGSFFPSPLTLNESGSNHNVKCTNCQVQIVSYACMQCEPGFGYCDTCFGTYKKDHTREHFFAVVKTNRRLRLVIENHPMRHGS